MYILYKSIYVHVYINFKNLNKYKCICTYSVCTDVCIYTDVKSQIYKIYISVCTYI